MKDNNGKIVEINDTVMHRHKPSHPTGKIVKILDGCNAICWVDFGDLILGKPHLTICCSLDIVKVLSF